MSEHFNGLTPAELECLAVLAEECGEVIHIIGKILRHGYNSIDPTKSNNLTNRALLEAELGDVFAIVERLIIRQDINKTQIEKLKRFKLEAPSYMHHNPNRIIGEYK